MIWLHYSNVLQCEQDCVPVRLPVLPQPAGVIYAQEQYQGIEPDLVPAGPPQAEDSVA